MIVGVLKEVKDKENRVALTPGGARELVRSGHRVLMETAAGAGSGFADERYTDIGAVCVLRDEVCARSDLILKIKEPVPDEYTIFKPGQILFTFFHFASNRKLTEAMQRSGALCIAYETVMTDDGRVPLLAPMSEVAGKMAPLVAANFLTTPLGGKGLLISSVAGIVPARILILGGGNAGRAAAEVALGVGAAVTILEKDEAGTRRVQQLFPGAKTLTATPATLAAQVADADAVIGTVHIPGARTPQLVSREMIRSMEPGSVVVDIAIDQGGCFETSRPTTHTEPVYVEERVLHYCVANMPGVFPRTATLALTNATLPYVRRLADEGLGALADPVLLRGLNVCRGQITNQAVSRAHGLSCADAAAALNQTD